jgi:hypothetical protein
MRPIDFVSLIRGLKFANTFNPYIHRCPLHDLDDAPVLRRSALLRILEKAVQTEVETVWIGRDLGHRGGRRTGLAFTDDLHVVSHGMRWNLTIKRATKGPPLIEQTAAVIWQVLSHIDMPIFLWNVFPLHPHEVGNPFSNRVHNAAERIAGESLLSELIAMIRPRRLIAIGNDAYRSVKRVSGLIEVTQVRHPSYGGQTRFIEQMRSS